ncbi:cell surface protein SprA [Mucilaginibacter gracilis]|uniref:Cell surface protein SprA n=1 Tax=Mucilaginibacter gracilis TaxID=423350 RepID=A0A495J9A2_9SPHI|nr:cell surface protein SprA [Mucilaginibacter gracilis]RKR85585.1 cell surface protein SprA [Mucilaginibacter gracilis]
MGGVLKKDSASTKYPIQIDKSNNVKALHGIFDQDPPNLIRTIEYDVTTNRYILTETVGNMLYRPVQYLTFSQYLALKQRTSQKIYWRQLADNYAYASQQPGFIPQIKINSHTFEQIFGSNTIDIRPQGSAEMVFAGQINKNENPLFNTAQRTQANFNFDQHIQMNVTGMIGDKLKINTNYNTDAQFQFENQIKLDYTGKPDEIIQKIEAGTVSMPLNTSLITGSQALFGVKTKLKFGRLDVTSIFSQQRSQSQQITITNGSQQAPFRLTPVDYEANKHYFLAQYFRDNYNNALKNIPIISSNVTITKIEVWTTNRNNSTTESRDIVAFLDLGENKPYNTTLVRGGGSTYPAGFNGPGYTQQSNDLLAHLPANARLTSSSAVNTYFQATGATDNYSKLTYARKLTDKEFTLHAQLGYISLNYPLNNDEVLSVAYRYSVNGVEYQVGEFSTDVKVDPTTPKVLFTKLLKNEILKTSLPTWKLMMKNIYSLGAYGISPSDFKLSITHLDNKSGIEKPIMEEGQNLKNKLWIQVTGLDNLNQQSQKQPDGYFDFLEGVTIDSQNGRISFPVLEPFGSDLAKQFLPSEAAIASQYIYQPLYDSTKTVAQQYFPQFNRFVIKGTYTSQSGSDYQLNAINIPQGSVVASSGSYKLVEGTDFTVDYNAGKVRILNQSLLSSGQPITINVENNELFGVQQKSLFGSRFDYKVDDKLNIGATIMHLSEQPITQKVSIGDEPISNTIWGFDANYSSSSRMLTRLVDKIPFISTKAPSSVNFSGEFAQLIPGHPSALNFAGANGTSYLDDFENSRSLIDIKSAINWQISGTPQLFPESQVSNDLSYGYNRARLAFYNIDPIFYNRSNSDSPPLANANAELSNHYVRQVFEQEVYPYKQSVTGTPLALPTLDLAFYPTIRGPYNFTTTGLNNNGTLQNPKTRWGGMFRKIDVNDFESLNVAYIEFWMLDPYIYKPTSQGGDLYFNLGSISEDILKDGRKSLENGLPADGDLTKVDETVWGRVPRLQPVVNSFDNNPDARLLQDVGLDGMNDADERVKYANIVQQVRAQLSTAAGTAFANDPSGDDFQFYRGGALDQSGAGILQRYAKYNGTEGNSMTAQQSQALLGISNSASTSIPDGEDVNRDNTMSEADEYFQYKVSVRPQDMLIGQNFITDKVAATVKLTNGTTQTVNWYQFRIPIRSYQSKVGNIQDFKAIRFIRMFMTNFADTAVLRFAALQLVRGEWRAFNTENNPANVIADAGLGTSPSLDNSTIDVGTVNIEENGTRTPIPYVVPPGIVRQRDYNNLAANVQLNEQSLSVTVKQLRDGYSRATFKTFNNDLRSYKHLQMFIHAEQIGASSLKDNDISAFIRMGIDYVDNYYEYETPLKVTLPGTSDANSIWPSVNSLDFDLSLLTNAKIARNNARYNGGPWPVNLPYTFTSGVNKITIKGQPDLSRLSTVMLGVRNPYRGNETTTSSDDGQDKAAIVWFNELRLTDFEEQGGWAATARLNAKLADFAVVTVSGSATTAGFGNIDQKVSQRSLNDTRNFDISTNMELGKFFPDKAGIRIPLYLDVSTQTSTPKYDPASPDLKIKDELAAASKATRDSILNVIETFKDYTMRKSVNLANVHKERTDTKAPVRVWDVENFSGTYAYTEYDHHDFTTSNALQKTYKVSLAYNYNNQPRYYAPFQKVIKSNLLALFRDFNYSLLPSRLNVRIDFDRLYSENTLRNNDQNSYIPVSQDLLTTFNKNFLITRVYGIGWNLSKSLQMDIDATNLSVVDEPAGRVNGLKADTMWNNLKHLGRTTDYSHNLNFNYTVPLNKIPGMDWTSLVAHYQTKFEWKTAPLFALTDPGLNVGNSIQNSRAIQLNPTLNMLALYNKLGFVRKANDANNKGSFSSALINLLTSVKSISGSYNRTEGTFIPGYLPKANFYGADPDYNAPGIGFLLGSQTDLRGKALANGWISSDTLQNQLYVTTLNEDMQFKSSIEPIKDLRIELSAFKTRNLNYQTNFKYSTLTNSFENLSPITSGDYSISYLSIATAFSKNTGIDNTSSVFQKFLDDRAIVSQRLGRSNPNSVGTTGGYADGYGPNSQGVLVDAFLAAYTGKNPNGSSTGGFPNIPIPNWQISYSGLGKLPFLAEIFDSFDLRHGYRSTYNVNGFSSLQRYHEANGGVDVRDANNDFLPYYQFSQITIFEQFVPLLGVDIRFHNSMTANIEYRQSRTLSLSLANSQLAQQNESNTVFGFGYRTNHFRFPFGLFSNLILNNDMNFKLDFSINDTKTLIYRADVQSAEVSSGAQNIAVRPSIDYMLNKRFDLKLFYDSTLTKPYTSQAFNTSFANFGFSLKLLLQ